MSSIEIPLDHSIGGLWGAQKIADYLGLKDRKSVMRLYEEEGLLMYPRRKASSPRWVWWSHPILINQWMLSKCNVERKRYLTRKHEKANARGNFDGVGAEET